MNRSQKDKIYARPGLKIYLRLTRGQQSSAVLFLQFHTNEQGMQWLERSSQGPETRELVEIILWEGGGGGGDGS